MTANSRWRKRGSSEALLNGLLRSPKTRPGLIAAVQHQGVTKNFVFGWLTEQIRTGKVTVLKAGDVPEYQITEFVVIEKPRPSGYPAWLDPRVVPPAARRNVYIDASLVQQHTIKGEQQQ